MLIIKEFGLVPDAESAPTGAAVGYVQIQGITDLISDGTHGIILSRLSEISQEFIRYINGVINMGESLTFNFNKATGAKKPARWSIGGRKVNVGRLSLVKKGFVDESTAAIFMAHRVKINPEGKPLKGLYGAPAADFKGVLLATDADEVYMADQRLISAEKLRQVWEGSVKLDKLKANVFKKALEARRKAGWWHVNDFETLAEELIVFELKSLGVASDKVKIGVNSAGDVIIRFPWAYPGARPRHRVFTYIGADIMKRPDERSLLHKLLQPGGVDFYFQKAAVDLMGKMEGYIPMIAEAAGKFLLISPTEPFLCNLGMGSRLAAILQPKFTLDQEVNGEYAKYFENPEKWEEKKHPYDWYLEYWKRTGG